MIVLRDVVEADLPILFEYQQEPEAHRVPGLPRRERDDFMAHWRANLLGCAAVTKKTIVVDGEVTGHVASFDRNGRRTVGYWLGKAYWGRGIASAALAEFVAAHEAARPLFAHVSVRNAGSRRVLEKCGFRQVGDAVRGPGGGDELVMQLGPTQSSQARAAW